MKLIQKERRDMLAALGRLLYRARWVALPLSLAVVLGAALYGFGVFGTLTSGGFEDPNSQSAHARALLDQQLGGSTADIVILLRSDTLSASDPAFASAATQLLDTLHTQPGVASVTSYYSTQSPRLLSRDGHETFAAVQLAATDRQAKERDYKTLKPLMTSPTLQVSVGGDLAVNDAVNAQVSADLERAEMLSFPVLAVLLVIVFAGLVAAGLPLVIGGVAILGAFAALRLLTGVTPISIFAVNVVTVLGLGLAIDYALFIVTRFREELDVSAGDTRRALERTLATAGRTVLFSGLTVSVSLLGLLLFPEGFLRSMGLGAISAVLVAMLAALILLPALLAILGRRVNSLSLQRVFRRSAAARPNREAHGAWYRLSQFVMRWPVPVAVAGLAILVTLGAPFLHASFSTPDVRVLPANQEARVVSDRLAQDFAQQGASSIVVAIRTPGDALSFENLARLDGYVRQIEAMPNVIAVQSLVSGDPSLTLADYQHLYAQPAQNPQIAAVAAQLAYGAGTKVIVELSPAEFSGATEDAVRQIRALHAPDGFQALVGGETAYQMDLFSNLRATLPYALAVIALAIFVLLFLMTGSVVMPIKAILLNTLSLTATFGALVWIFQDGHLSRMLGFTAIGAIEAWVPVIVFTFAFGLSMDYEVFLLSRIKEAYEECGDTDRAVANGLQRSGRIITCAAFGIMIVFLGFAAGQTLGIKEMGLALAIAVAVDATLVRCLLVPATMTLLGKANWWAPAPLRRIYERFGMREAPAATGPRVPEPEPSRNT
jgi:RND superfamily putative drug exporter